MPDTVDTATGEVQATRFVLEELRDLEEMITALDGQIAELKDQLKAAREAWEAAVLRLRARVRGTRPLPLLDDIGGDDAPAGA